MQCFSCCTDKTIDLCRKSEPEDHWAPADQSPTGTALSTVKFKGPASFLLDMRHSSPVLTAGLGLSSLASFTPPPSRPPVPPAPSVFLPLGLVYVFLTLLLSLLFAVTCLDHLGQFPGQQRAGDEQRGQSQYDGGEETVGVFGSPLHNILCPCSHINHPAQQRPASTQT